MARSFESMAKGKGPEQSGTVIDFLERLRQKRVRDGIPNANLITHEERDPSELWNVAEEVIGDMEEYIRARPELGITGDEIMRKRDELLRETALKNDRGLLEDQLRAVIKKYEERTPIDKEEIVARLALALAYTWEDDP